MKRKILQLLVALVVPLSWTMPSFADTVGDDFENGTVPGGSGADGTLNYQSDLFTGRFTYSVPIKVPPARQGSQPHLKLGYNSAFGNSWCGVGWTLDVGSIQRSTTKGTPVMWGTTNALPMYDDSKGFVFETEGSSVPLVLVSGTNQNPIVYRAQVDTSFSTYNFYTNNHWEVVDKGGNVFFFGEGTTNQMVNTKSNWTQGVSSSTFRWALDKVINPNGNATFFSYLTNNGMLYLTNISYNANTNSPGLSATHSINFILTNRPDTNFSYISNFRVQTEKLLSEIDIQVSGTNVRKYVLGYTTSPSTLRSLLSSVTEYGSDFTTSLPPVTFGYQVQSFAFGPETAWGGVNDGGITNDSGRDAIDACYFIEPWLQIVKMIDVDGDGLPDRVMTTNNIVNASPWLFVQRNTGSNFLSTNYAWMVFTNSNSTAFVTELNSSNNATEYELLDMDGDGYPDFVNHTYNTNYFVARGSGIMQTGWVASASYWGPVTNAETSDYGWLSLRLQEAVDMMDMNGDGLPDRVYRKMNTPYDRLRVQLNTNGGFTMPVDWATLDSQGDTTYAWNTLSQQDTGGNYFLTMQDLNGDGLPDRIMRKYNPPYTNFVVQFNNGAGFEPAVNWGPLDSQGNTNQGWNSPIASDNGNMVGATLVDMNGDGLPDRVLRLNSPYTNWLVQLNTGSGWGPATNWIGVSGQGQTSPDWTGLFAKDTSSDTYVDFLDINGDGLPDRVMRKFSSPYTNFVVQLNKGPFPDLMNVVSNGIGGSVQVSYVASTTLDNRNTNWVSDPWAEGTKSLLPFNVWVVSQVTAQDGMGNTNMTSYAFKGGYYYGKGREFRGFSQVTVTDPFGGKTTTYFHQSGGRDNSALGEFQDQTSFAKKGLPFRVEKYGTNGLLYQLMLSKVMEYTLNTNGWYFPCATQTLMLNYEGLGSYRATATQYSYDTNTGNMVSEADLGEVTNIVVNGQTFTDIGSNSIYKWMTYTNIGNILNRVADTKATSDSAGSNRLQEMLKSYDGAGNLLVSQSWLDTASTFVTISSNTYNQYGNVTQTMDAAGITTANSYDSTYQQYLVSQSTASFTSQSTFNPLFGGVVQTIDAKGLVSSNTYDVFFRPTASYTSTNAFGTPNLWVKRSFYQLGGMSNGISLNCVHSQVNDGVDAANGFETYAYSDGLGRGIETRTEAETGQFRVANTVFDSRGKSYFQTLTYFSSGTNYTAPSGTNLGTLTAYDPIGRAFQTTPSVQGIFSNSGLLTNTIATDGDTNSPVGSTITAFVDGSNPWATVVTDPSSKIKKSYRDAFGRTTQVTEVTTNGNINTTYFYSALGNLTNVTDNAGNVIGMAYDSLGRKISMVDPDMGTWNYSFDNAGRITQQVDARNNKLTFSYSDPLGRLASKQIYNASSSLVGTVTYTYDTSDDPNYTVLKGQLYKVTDLQGYERNSYDVRGRVLKTGRYLSFNAMEYTTQTTYDDAGHIQQLTYPGNTATIQYSYDTANHLSQIASTSGTGTNEIFYSPTGGFNALNQLQSYNSGNGVQTVNSYYPNSTRVKRVQVNIGTTNLQDLSYTYDTASDLSSIGDGVYSGAASASITNIAYDDLYRLTSMTSTARGTKAYAYDALGNVLTNQDLGSGLYQYGLRPHAVTNANGTSYGYDACGNMTSRGAQTLTFDEQNQLAQVSTTNDVVTFGYDESGERLWRHGTNGYSIWIGDIYEINNGKVLCHVRTGDKLVASFEPQCNAGMSQIFGEKRWYAFSTRMEKALAWPFQHGRGQWTLFGGTWAGILALCLIACRRMPLNRYELRKALRPVSLWRQAITIAIISAILFGTMGNAEAVTYNPVFYYYHTDHLGSSNVLTDRYGGLVQHYEYTPFGQTSYQNNTSAFALSNRYTSQICDDETGLYYYGGRYYDPQLSRFVQPDPTVPDPTASQSSNRYSYVRNNPFNEVDPSGYADQFGNSSDDDSGFGSQLINPVSDFISWSVNSTMGQPLDAMNNSALDDAMNGPSLTPSTLIGGLADAGESAAMLPFSIAYGVGSDITTAVDGMDENGMAVSGLDRTLAGLDAAMFFAPGLGEMAGAGFEALQGSRAIGGIAGFGDAAYGAGDLTVGSGLEGDIRPAAFVRQLSSEETFTGVVDELKQLTFQSRSLESPLGLEHGIVSLTDGTRWIVSGGQAGIDFGGIKNMQELIAHTHGIPTGPSGADFNFLTNTGQKSSFIVELGNPKVIQFEADRTFRELSLTSQATWPF